MPEPVGLAAAAQECRYRTLLLRNPNLHESVCKTAVGVDGNHARQPRASTIAPLGE